MSGSLRSRLHRTGAWGAFVCAWMAFGVVVLHCMGLWSWGSGNSLTVIGAAWVAGLGFLLVTEW